MTSITPSSDDNLINLPGKEQCCESVKNVMHTITNPNTNGPPKRKRDTEDVAQTNVVPMASKVPLLFIHIQTVLLPSTPKEERKKQNKEWKNEENAVSISLRVP